MQSYEFALKRYVHKCEKHFWYFKKLKKKERKRKEIWSDMKVTENSQIP